MGRKEEVEVKKGNAILDSASCPGRGTGAGAGPQAAGRHTGHWSFCLGDGENTGEQEGKTGLRSVKKY